MLRRRIALAAAVALAFTACTGPGEESPAPATPSSSTSAAPTQEATPVELPDTAVGEAAAWILELLAGDSGPTAEEAEQRFGEEFLSQVPADQVAQVFDQLRAEGPFTLVSWDGTPSQGSGLLQSPETPVRMMVALKGEKIDGLMFVPEEQAPEVESPSEASQALQDEAASSSFLLAEVVRGEESAACEAVESRDADKVLPIGSMFKLYVLGAVVTAIEDGELAWDQELTVTDELKSLPSGDLRNEPVGTKVPVEILALKMISESDNTATDILIDAVGREAVEAEMEAMGHHAPELNRPFLTTREAFQLAADKDLRSAWAEASQGYDDASPSVSDAQRAMLGDLPAWDLSFDEATMSDPFWDQGIDWFATAEDLCAAHVALQQRAATEAGKPVRAILSEYPGIEVTGAAYVGFKGGSAPGELGLSFYVEGPEAIRVLVMQTAGESVQDVPQAQWLANLAERTLG